MRWWGRVLVVLVVLAGLGLVVDRAAAWAAQRAVADQVAGELVSRQVDSAPPEVSVGGFPFLTQVAAGEYDQVTLRLRDVGSGPLRLPVVELTATGVTAPVDALVGGGGSIVAAQIRGEATVGYDQVRALTGREALTFGADGGRVTLRLPVELGGQELTLVGTASVGIAGHAIAVRVDSLGVEGPAELPQGAQPLVDRIAQELSVEVPLPPLPYDLAVESVRPERSGLVVTVRAHDVVLSR
jgi:hypothetical protein